MRFITTLAVFALFSLPVHADKLLTPLNHQQAITVQPKEQITVKLPSDPSTGYMWFLDPESGDGQRLKMIQDWRFTPRNQTLASTQGDTTWRFSAQQEGKVTLRFVYRKPWQGQDATPLDVREFQLTIAKASDQSS